MPYDAPAHAVAAALYASNQKDGYFQLSVPGTIQVLDDGRTQFTPSDSGRHRYIIVDPAQKDRIVKAFTTLVSAKPIPPAPRVPRPRPGNQAAPPANNPAEPPPAPNATKE